MFKGKTFVDEAVRIEFRHHVKMVKRDPNVESELKAYSNRPITEVLFYTSYYIRIDIHAVM